MLKQYFNASILTGLVLLSLLGGLSGDAFARNGGNGNHYGWEDGDGGGGGGSSADDGGAATSASSQVTLTATIPSVVIVKVNQGSSTLSASVSPNLVDSSANVASSDFQVKGSLLANAPSANVQCTVSDTELKLTNGNDEITVNLSGTIGGTTISESGFTPTFSSRQAAINITGDLDESTVSSLKLPGTYSGTFTITASLL